MENAYIVVAHGGNPDTPADWTICTGANAESDAILTARRWKRDHGWEYVAVRPAGGAFIVL